MHPTLKEFNKTSTYEDCIVRLLNMIFIYRVTLNIYELIYRACRIGKAIEGQGVAVLYPWTDKAGALTWM